MTHDTPVTNPPPARSRHTGKIAGSLLGLGMIGMATAAIADPTLTYFTWAGYDLPEFHDSYSAKYGGEPKYAYFPDSEEAFNKLKQGFAVDLAHPCLPHIKRWKETGLLKPIDISKIANWNDVFPALRENPSVTFDGATWMVPWEWGASSLIYRTDKANGATSSYQMLLDPKYKGLIAIPDNIDEMSMLATLLAGIKDPYELTDADYAAISEKMKALVSQARFLWSDATTVNQAMASGEISMFWGWPSTWVDLQKAGVPVEYMSNPKEGVVGWACGLVISKNSTANEAELYDFINAEIDPKSGQALMAKYGYGHSNQKSFEGVDAKTLDKLGLSGDVGSLLTKGNLLSARPEEQRKKLIELWEQAKLEAQN